MAWYAVSPQSLRQDDPQAVKSWFFEDSPAISGSLLIWSDPAGTVQRFQLAYFQPPTGPEYLAEWTRGRAIRRGIVDDSRPTIARKASPIVTYQAVDETVLAQMRAYFVRNGGILEPCIYQDIALALGLTPEALS